VSGSGVEDPPISSVAAVVLHGTHPAGVPGDPRTTHATPDKKETVMRMISIAAFVSLLVSATAAGAVAATPDAAAPPVAPPEELETLTTAAAVGSGPRLTGWFVAPTFATTGFGGTLTSSPGLRGGIYLNRRVAIGLTANGLFNSDSSLSRHEAQNLGSYGGLLLQYVFHSNALIHASFETTIGKGRWCTAAKDGDDGCAGRDFMVFEPVANLEVNFARHVRFETGVGYRFAVAGSGAGPSSGDMSSLVARSALVFGSF
jgi:hypothetical protein